jgi:hypothetical protein
METAKVDIRKLQLLNDSINRTIEALNQVRLSVHGIGISHSAAAGPQALGASAYPGYPAAAYASPYGLLPQAAPQLLGALSSSAAGLAHLAAGASSLPPWAAQGLGPSLSPYAAQSLGPSLSPYAAQSFGPSLSPYAAQASGLGHSGLEARLAEYADPYLPSRIAHTFPFVSWSYSPFALQTA